MVLRPTPGLAFCFASLNITEKYISKRVGVGLFKRLSNLRDAEDKYKYLSLHDLTKKKERKEINS